MWMRRRFYIKAVRTGTNYPFESFMPRGAYNRDMMAKLNCCGYLLTCVLLIAEFGDSAPLPLLGGKTLIIGVPKKQGFTQFVDVKPNSSDEVTGYSIEVFNATAAYLQRIGCCNISFKFSPFVNKKGESAGTYDSLLEQIGNMYDAVVGDVTIVANRSTYVDFTLPYAESGVKMLVQVRHDGHLNMWIFLRPFSWDLWLSIIIVCIFIGFTIRLMERNANKDASIENSPSKDQFRGISSILWLPLAQMVLPHGESVAKNCSRFVLVVWLILAFVLMQSYTANLSSILTLNQLQPSYPSLNDLMENGDFVGHQTNSFVRDFLIDNLKFPESRLRNYSSPKQYREALRKGSVNGGVAAIFAEIPYIKVFLKQYGSKYKMAGPRYRTDGFGFAFPMGSNLTSYFSRAILNVTEGEEMVKIEQKYFGSSDDELQDQSDQVSSDNPSLTTYSFAGLFLITGSLTLFALLISERGIWQKPVRLAKTFSNRYLSYSRSRKANNQPMDDSNKKGNAAGSTGEANDHVGSSSSNEANLAIEITLPV